jgi:hypothetical protein
MHGRRSEAGKRRRFLGDLSDGTEETWVTSVGWNLP